MAAGSDPAAGAASGAVVAAGAAVVGGSVAAVVGAAVGGGAAGALVVTVVTGPDGAATVCRPALHEHAVSARSTTTPTRFLARFPALRAGFRAKNPGVTPAVVVACHLRSRSRRPL